MNPYALPAIIAFSSLLILGLAAILQNPQDKRNRLLFALCLNYALIVGAAAMLHLSSSEAAANFWNKWPYIFGIPSYILTLEYVLQICELPGYQHNDRVTHINSQVDNIFSRISLVDYFALNQPHHRTTKILFSFRLGTPIWTFIHTNDVFWVLFLVMPSVCSLSWYKIRLAPPEGKSDKNNSCSFDW